MTITLSQRPRTRIASVEDPESTLERRLTEGYLLIEQHIANGQDYASLESHWMKLLREYEELVSGHREAA